MPEQHKAQLALCFFMVVGFFLNVRMCFQPMRTFEGTGLFGFCVVTVLYTFFIWLDYQAGMFSTILPGM